MRIRAPLTDRPIAALTLSQCLRWTQGFYRIEKPIL